MTFGASPVAKYREYYKGEGGGFPQVQAVVHGAHAPSVHQKCSNYALTNLLFGLCSFMWIIDPLVVHCNSHLEALTHPFTFEMLRTKERAPIPCPFVIFTFGLVIESIQEFKGVLDIKYYQFIFVIF
jgi:hypothetical protein